MDKVREYEASLGAVGGDAARHVVGVYVSTMCTQISASLGRVFGRGETLKYVAVGAKASPVDEETRESFERVKAARLDRAGEAGRLASRLGELQAALIETLCQEHAISPSEVLVVGLSDPGLWDVNGGPATGYQGLSDAATVAHRTGITCVDAFAAKDLAAGGHGGPVNALPLASLLSSYDDDRIVLELGRTVRLTYLPSKARSGPADIRSFDVGPGTALVDYLTRRFTEGKHQFDPGGRLAVQGKRVPELAEHWLADPYFQQPLPRWYPLGVQSEEELEKSVEMAVQSGWSVCDLLCTATHFIAETISRAIQDYLPADLGEVEVVLTGGGRLNGLLLKEIGDRLNRAKLRMITELGFEPGSLKATSAAILAMWNVDRVHATRTEITGATSPQILGRLTPGCEPNWQRVLTEMAIHSSQRTNLREAG